MLNTFYKIISGVITRRLKPTLQRIVKENQKAYLPGRYIGESTRTIYDIIDYSIKNKITGHAILVDFKKAFDSISHNFLRSTLKILNFSDKVIKWINTILSGFQSQTLVNGHLGEVIRLLRGCRQGDPIAGYLFILAIEILLFKLRSLSLIHI